MGAEIIHFKEPRSLAGLSAKLLAVFPPNQRAAESKTGPGRASRKPGLRPRLPNPRPSVLTTRGSSCCAAFPKTCTLMPLTLPRPAFTRLSSLSSRFPPIT